MKKLILTITLITLSLKSIGQVSPTNEYKDYNPCTNCASVDPNTNNNSFKQTGSNIKESTKREVVGRSTAYKNRVKSNFIRVTETVVITTLTVATSAVINKIK